MSIQYLNAFPLALANVQGIAIQAPFRRFRVTTISPATAQVQARLTDGLTSQGSAAFFPIQMLARLRRLEMDTPWTQLDLVSDTANTTVSGYWSLTDDYSLDPFSSANVDNLLNINGAGGGNYYYSPAQSMGLTRVTLAGVSGITGGGSFQVYGVGKGLNINIPIYDANGFLLSQVGKVQASDVTAIVGGGSATFYVDGATWDGLLITFGGFTGSSQVGYFSINSGLPEGAAQLKKYPAPQNYAFAYAAWTSGTVFAPAIAGKICVLQSWQASGTPGGAFGVLTIEDATANTVIGAGWVYILASDSVPYESPLGLGASAAGNGLKMVSGAGSVAFTARFGYLNV